MKAPIKEKQSYGTVKIDSFSPARADGWPEAVNVTLSFEEALKPGLCASGFFASTLCEPWAHLLTSVLE